MKAPQARRTPTTLPPTRNLNEGILQVLARFREGGPPTIPHIQAVSEPYLQYADPSQIEVIETDREGLRKNNTVVWTGSLSFTTISGSITITVSDGPLVSPAGLQVDLVFSAITDLGELAVEITNPVGVQHFRNYNFVPIGRGQPVTNVTFNPLTPAFPDPTVSINAVWYDTSMTATWFVGDGGVIYSYTGGWASWTSGTANNLRGVWGSAANAVWAVGTHGTALYFDGTSWAPITSNTTETLTAIWGSASNNVWAVGTNGAIIYYAGVIWVITTSPTTSSLFAVWGSASNDVWAVGQTGTIIHYNGTAWSSVPSPTIFDLVSIVGIAFNNVYALGSLGDVIHWDGTSWTYLTSLGVALSSGWWDGTYLWVVSLDSGIFSYNGTLWTNYPAPGGGVDLLCATYTGTNPIVAGTLGTVLEPAARAVVRVYFPEFAHTTINGTWTIAFAMGSGSATLVEADLFVEGLGRDSAGNDGKGAPVFEWAVGIQDSWLGTNYNLDGLYPALRRINYATRRVTILRQNDVIPGPPPGLFIAIPNEAIPDSCIPG